MKEVDAFNFANLKIFNDIKDNLQEGTSQICDVFEDLLFVWKSNDGNLSVVSWRAAQSKDVSAVKDQVGSSHRSRCKSSTITISLSRSWFHLQI